MIRSSSAVILTFKCNRCDILQGVRTNDTQVKLRHMINQIDYDYKEAVKKEEPERSSFVLIFKIKVLNQRKEVLSRNLLTF